MRRVVIRPIRPVLVLAALVMCWVLTALAGQEDRNQDARLSTFLIQLTEDAAYPLPVSLHVTGASIGPRGAVVYWATGQGTVGILKRHSRFQHFESFANPIAAAFVEGDSVVEVIDGATRSITSVHLTSQQMTGRGLAVDFELLQASWASGWFLGRDVRGQVYEVWMDRPASPPRKVATVEASDFPVDSVETVYITKPAGANVLIVAARPPQLLVLGANDVIVHRIGTELDSLIAVAESTRPLSIAGDWVALRVVPLDCGFIQTIADLRSDRRLLVLYNPDWTVLTHRLIEVPLGIVASYPEEQLLVAIRRLTRPELVIYRWAWTAAGSHYLNKKERENDTVANFHPGGDARSDSSSRLTRERRCADLDV